jgi:hypothetical protein
LHWHRCSSVFDFPKLMASSTCVRSSFDCCALAGFGRVRLDVKGLQLDPSMLKYLSC